LDLLHKLAEIKQKKKIEYGPKAKTQSHTQSEKSGAISVCVDGDNIAAATATSATATATAATNIAAGLKTRGRGSDMKLYLDKKCTVAFN